LPPPVRLVVVRGVVGNRALAPAAYVDGVDLIVDSGSGVALISDLLAAGRVGGIVVARGVVGDVAFVPSARVDGVDLGVVPVVAPIRYPLA
jgi:hypothetical protein